MRVGGIGGGEAPVREQIRAIDRVDVAGVGGERRVGAMFERRPDPFVAIAAFDLGDDVHPHKAEGGRDAKGHTGKAALGRDDDQAIGGDEVASWAVQNDPSRLQEDRGRVGVIAALGEGDVDPLPRRAIEAVVADIGGGDGVHARLVEDVVAVAINQRVAIGLVEFGDDDVSGVGFVRAMIGGGVAHHIVAAGEVTPPGPAPVHVWPIQRNEGLPRVAVKRGLRHGRDNHVFEKGAELRHVLGEVRAKLIIRGRDAKICALDLRRAIRREGCGEQREQPQKS